MMYVAIDINPESGCDIQDEVCGKYRIVIFFMKTYVEEESNIINQYQDGVLHGTNIMLNIVFPWVFSDIIVCDGLCFISVAAAEALKDTGLCFYWSRQDFYQ